MKGNEFLKKNLFLTFITLILNRCSNKDNPTMPLYFGSTNNPYFPLKIGNTWTYEFLGSGVKAVIKREIKNQLIHEDGSLIYGYYEGILTNNPDQDTLIYGYFTIRKRDLYYYSGPRDTTYISSWKMLTLKYPLIKEPFSNGTSWVATDTFQIRTSSPVFIKDKTYSNVLLVVSTNRNYIDSTWYAEGIGEIQRKNYFNGTYAEYKLRSFSLK